MWKIQRNNMPLADQVHQIQQAGFIVIDTEYGKQGDNIDDSKMYMTVMETKIWNMFMQVIIMREFHKQEIQNNQKIEITNVVYEDLTGKVISYDYIIKDK